MSSSASETDPVVSTRVLLWLGALGFLVRLLYFSEHATSAFFNVPILDEKYYDALAQALVENRDPTLLNPGFRPLLYPFFLALWYQLGGDWGRALAIFVQHLLGVLTALGIADVAARLFRRTSAGALAGGLYLLAGPPLYFEGELAIAVGVESRQLGTPDDIAADANLSEKPVLDH